ACLFASRAIVQSGDIRNLFRTAEVTTQGGGLRSDFGWSGSFILFCSFPAHVFTRGFPEGLLLLNAGDSVEHYLGLTFQMQLGAAAGNRPKHLAGPSKILFSQINLPQIKINLFTPRQN